MQHGAGRGSTSGHIPYQISGHRLLIASSHIASRVIIALSARWALVAAVGTDPVRVFLGGFLPVPFVFHKASVAYDFPTLFLAKPAAWA